MERHLKDKEFEVEHHLKDKEFKEQEKQSRRREPESQSLAKQLVGRLFLATWIQGPHC